MVIMNINMPQKCAECPCHYATEGAFMDMCQLKWFSDDNITYENRDECDILEFLRKDTKPEWCPLIIVKHKEEINDEI